MQRCGVFVKRLRNIVLTAVPKGGRDAATEAAGALTSGKQGRCNGSQQQLETLIRQFNDCSRTTPVSNSGLPFLPGGRYVFRTANSSIGALGYSHVRNHGTTVSHRLLITGFGATTGAPKATFCAEAGVGAATESVRNHGSKRNSVAMNLMRRVQRAGQEKSERMLLYLLAMVVAVVGVTYASVPLYRRFCQATGYGGTVQRRETVEEKIARHGAENAVAPRELVVHFNADVADSMPWKFKPCQSQVKVKVGQSTLAFYRAENTSMEDITGVSTYNVAPMQAGMYFNKIQCFCFEEQRLRPGEKIDMPVLFYVDPEFAADPKMDSINSLILSYTFFKVDEGEEDQ